MIRSYKIRLLPNKDQEQLMWDHIDCCRFVWNYMLDYQQTRYESGKKHLSGYDMINLLTSLKKASGLEWLKKVSSQSLNIVCQDLDKAYKSFFNKISGFPKFKSRKKSKPSFPLKYDRVIFCEDNTVKLEKLGKVKFKTNYDLPVGKGVKFTNPRIAYVDNKWILSFGIDSESQAVELTDKRMGIDLGIKELATVAFEDECLVFHNINKSRLVRRLERKLRHLQRNVNRKYRTNGKSTKTNNIIKAKEEVRRLSFHIAQIRNNCIHQTTHKIVELRPYKIVMEDLNVAGMMKNRHLSKSIQSVTWHEFVRQMRYKCEWSGIEFVQANRFYPSSKTCSCCGVIRKVLTLKERTFVCPDCGFTIDRDYNAAINLMRYAG